MKKIVVLVVGMILICGFPLLAQIQPTEDTEQHDALHQVGIARELVIRGYQEQEPLFLLTAAQILTEHPVKGTLLPDSIAFENACVAPSRAGITLIKLQPDSLLKDASLMAGNDSALLQVIARTREKITLTDGLSRGRKFSPLIQEFKLNSHGSVKLWATFNAHEIAEIFVAGDGNTTLDLYLYDNNGTLIASDVKNIDDCYVSFTPSGNQKLRIEIKNNGPSGNQCLLMTN